jgi:glucosamine kinase
MHRAWIIQNFFLLPNVNQIPSSGCVWVNMLFSSARCGFLAASTELYFGHQKKRGVLGMGGKFLIGIDGGGTKTKVKITDQNGKLIGAARGGAAQIRYSVAEAWSSIMSAIDSALAGTGLDYNNPDVDFYVAMGLAGTEVAAAKEEFLAQTHPFTSLKLYSDAYTACLGAHAASDGGVLIMGTGVHARAIVGAKEYRVGGWGFPHDDQGGGAWLGLAAVQHAFAVHDGREQPTPLSEHVLAQFETEAELVAWATASDARGFAILAPIVMACARHQNKKAREIVLQAANYLEIAIETLISKSGKPDLAICCLGGMAAPMLDFLQANIRKHIVEPKGESEDGALYLARQDLLALNNHEFGFNKDSAST